MNTPTIDIVPFSPHHAEDVIPLILSIQQSELGIPISLDAQSDLLDIPDVYQSGYGNFWVALAGQEVVGTVALLDIGDMQAALPKMFVRADHRGPAHGVATQLLEALLAWGRKHRVRDTFLATHAGFLAANQLYEKNGFRPVARTQLPSSFPIMEANSTFYCRSLRLPVDCK